MAQHRSISQRLKRAKSRDARQATLQKWTQAWQQEQSALIWRIGKAIADDDFDAACIAVGELKSVSVKKFEALPKVLEVLLHDTQNTAGDGSGG